jgi:hypothetical protein
MGAILADGIRADRVEGLAVALADPDAALAACQALAARGRQTPWRARVETARNQ